MRSGQVYFSEETEVETSFDYTKLFFIDKHHTREKQTWKRNTVIFSTGSCVRS